MSDIQKKTLPPGSWPGSKSGGPKTAETASEAGDNVPRSVNSHPPVSKTDEGGSDSVDDDATSGSQNYTHQKEKDQLDDITEEAGSSRADGADGAEGSEIQMHDEEKSEQKDEPGVDEQSQAQTKEQKPEAEPETQTEQADDLKDVEPEPIQEKEPESEQTKDEQQSVDDKTHTPQTAPTEEIPASEGQKDTAPAPSQAQEEVSQTGEEQQTEQAEDEAAAAGGTSETDSKTSQLTEQAKKAFDLASQNQPTDQARDEFLQSAKDDASAPPPAAQSEITGDSGKPETQTEGAEQTQTEQQEQPATTETEGGDDKSEIPPSELKTQDQEGQTVAAPSEYTYLEVQPGTETQGGDGQTQTGPASTSGLQSEFQDQQDRPGPQSTTGGKTVSFKSPTEGTSVTEESQTQDQTQSQSQSQAQDVDQSQLDQAQEQGQEQQGGEGEGTNAPESTAGVTVPEQLDFSVLKDGTVNKGGNIVDSSGKVVGRVTQGILQYLVGKKVDENGDIWSENGKVIGKAEPITDSERDDMMKEPAPFESFEDAVVDGNGMVVSNGEWVGKVVSGDLKTLRGRPVDKDGDILDKGGNVIGKAERWEPEPEEEPEPEPEVDKSLLAGKRVNKAGYLVDGQGNIFGRVVEGDPKKMVGRMCDKNGNILSESGDVLGKAELVPEGEREGSKEGPFAELEGCTVAKDGTVVTPSGDIVGRLVSGDGKVLFGRSVDEDGDVLDRNGNVIGKAERWAPEEVEKKKNPMSGRRVNKEANVVDEDGNIIGKLTSGDPRICAGKEIDDDGDVVDGKGTVIGHCSLLEDIPAEEESPEDKAKREQAEQDKKLAIQMAVCVEQCLDKIRPICKMITEKIDKAERTPEDERDEEALVREVRPLIEEGGRILTEAKGVIKGLDPDGRISANAKHKTAAREATPEEYHLADVLKDLTGDVTQCIENAKKKLEDMPHAKKELNPLWGLLNEPLFQILAAVGLLLSGVLGLVGRLVSLLP
ncbi:Protein of unknown function (DUF3659) domain containing protein [Naviculisporaceae sp. PSN 640]